MESRNPWTGQVLQAYEAHTAKEQNVILDQSVQAYEHWSKTSFVDRAKYMENLGVLLQQREREFAQLITSETGKLYSESIVEVQKCSWLCEYYAEFGAYLLEESRIQSDATASGVSYHPLGPILGIMPWNFPFWQVLRFAVPTIIAGNTILVKHASNVTGCALALERLFLEAGFPKNSFQTLILPGKEMEAIVRAKQVKGVAITGGEQAGRKVASWSAEELKPHVLELGGSDPFVVLEDADLNIVVPNAIKSRFGNAGQVCIAAKRFIIAENLYDDFVERLSMRLGVFEPGDPMNNSTQLAPLASPAFCGALQIQLDEILRHGGKRILGTDWAPQDGCCFPAQVLVDLPDHPSVKEELFGPVALIYKVSSEEEAIAIANDTEFGLGASVWTANSEKGKRIAQQIQAGAVFVNGVVKSDPRLPFGGTKNSGYGRELAREGIRAFTNSQTFWVN